MRQLKEIFLNLLDLRRAIDEDKVARWVYEFVMTGLVLISLFVEFSYSWVLAAFLLPICVFELVWTVVEFKGYLASRKDKGDDRG